MAAVQSLAWPAAHRVMKNEDRIPQLRAGRLWQQFHASSVVPGPVHADAAKI